MEQKWRCQKCGKPLSVKTDLNKPKKVRCCKCGRVNRITKQKNGKCVIF